MKITVLNGSPKGKHSITRQYVVYLQRKYSEHSFEILNVSQKIKKLERDESRFLEIIEKIKNSDCVIWSFGLWVLAVPAQFMRFIELVQERNSESAFENVYTAAISTSINFYDHTAHNYIRGVCEDFGMKYIDGISLYMLDFMKENKRNDLDCFFENAVDTIQNAYPTTKLFSPFVFNDFKYQPGNTNDKINTNKKVVVLIDKDAEDSNSSKMAERYADSFSPPAELINFSNIKIMGACLGCMKCGYDYHCQYKDDFKEFYNTKIITADLLVFAGEMKGRYLSSIWKTFFDRAFFWNHTPSMYRKQIAYLISGPISQNLNLQQILEGNVTARQSANLVDIISDESADSETIDRSITRLAERMVEFSDREYVKPENFLKVGGHKIFRDEIFGHIRAVWQADHRYFKKHGLYDFEQKNYGMRIMNSFLFLACRIPVFRKKFYGNLMKFPARRYGQFQDRLFQENQYQ